MITENEIRIGNLLQDEADTPLYVAGIWQLRNGKYHYMDSDRNIYTKRQLYPITLTTELLKKCGFVPEEYESQDGRVREWNKDNSVVIEQPLKSGEVFLFCHHNYTQIFHLHQLQTLYFALTGEELQVTL